MLRLNTPAAQEALAEVTHIYTDLDGTMLAPGGRLLTNHKGKPSLELAKALVKLKQAGIEVIIVTGRDAISSTEIMRVTDLTQFFAEMGCIVQQGYGQTAEKRYLLGEWSTDHFDQDYDHGADISPREMIEKSGIVTHLLEKYKDKLEVHNLIGSHREVTVLLRGSVDTSPGGEIETLFSGFELPLQLLDNGVIHPKDHGLLSVDEVHIYHLTPKGTGKGAAVAWDMELKGLSPEQTVAIGDAEGDASMGAYTGSFVLVDNHKKSSPVAYTQSVVADPHALFTTSLPSADGWVEFAHAILSAQHQKAHGSFI